jgi:glycosyltransferase involved in cell wall biosynthesis
VTGAAPRISIVLHSFDRGGSGRVAGYLARGFAEHGLDVELVVLCRCGDAEAAVRQLVGDAAPIRFLGTLRGPRPSDLVRGLPALVRALRARQPDVVIAAANNVALVTAAAVIAAGLDRADLFLKTTNPIAGSRHRGLVGWLRRTSYALAFRRYDGVWTLSEPETGEMVAAFPSHAHLFRTVANPYVTAAMLALRPRRTAPGVTVIAVARLTRQKRLERLIRGFSRVAHPDARLLVLGEGEERAALTALVADLGLGERVTMPGHVNDVAAALHSADLFVLTSDYEGLPAVVLEAMATDCPVLSTDCFPAARALLAAAPGCGIIEDTAPDALAAMIDARLDRPRPTGLRAIAERYSLENGVRSHVTAMSEGGRHLSGSRVAAFVS